MEEKYRKQRKKRVNCRKSIEDHGRKVYGTTKMKESTWDHDNEGKAFETMNESDKKDHALEDKNSESPELMAILKNI